MKYLKSKVSIGVVCFVVGVVSTFGIQKVLTRPNEVPKTQLSRMQSMDPLFDQFFDENFFGRSRDPFEEMRSMRKRMLKNFDEGEGGGIFDSWYKKKFGGGSAGEVSQREDGLFLYYDIAINGLKQDNVKVEVRNGQISISGQVEKKSEEGNTNAYFSSSFHRSFPVPLNVDASKIQMEQANDRIVIKFPKVLEKHT